MSFSNGICKAKKLAPSLLIGEYVTLILEEEQSYKQVIRRMVNV